MVRMKMTAPDTSPLDSPVSVEGSPRSSNKRKFRGETPTDMLEALDPSLEFDSPGYELFSGERVCDYECNVVDCFLCRGPGSREERIGESGKAEWVGLTETQLEEILLRNLDVIFKGQIKLIVSYGYSEEVAMNTLLRAGICCGSKDTISNVLDNALAFLRSGQEVDSSLRENFSEDMRDLEKHVLADMVRVIRKVRPRFSIGDALWCLLICDMNLKHACTMEDEFMNVKKNGDSSSGATVPQLELQSGSNVPSSPVIPESNILEPSRLNMILPRPQNTPQPGQPTAKAIPSLPSGRFSASRNGDGTISSSEYATKSSSSTKLRSCPPEEKRPGGRKGGVGVSKKESIPRQRAIHHEKSHRTFRSKAVIRTSKVSSSSGLVLDNRFSSSMTSTGMTVKDVSLKPINGVRTHSPQVRTPVDPRLSSKQSATSSYGTETAHNPSALPTANTELSLSIPCAVTTRSTCNVGDLTSSNYLGISSDRMREHSATQDKRGEMMFHLVHRVDELQSQLDDWKEWAEQKVMQAARRLGKDKAELQTLRKEKEELARLKMEKHILEENTQNKLSEMETALSKANIQVEQANAVAYRLQDEKARLRQELEAENSKASKSAAECQEASHRESVTLKKLQSVERHKAPLPEELTTEKCKLSQLQQQLEQAREVQNQRQAVWKQEATMEEEALAQADSMKKEREQMEVSGKAKENAFRLKAEIDMQKYKDDARRIEDQISQLRVKIDSSKIAALRYDVAGKYASQFSDGRKDSSVQSLAKIMDSLDLGAEDVQRERECVMCLAEERIVVFLPCAHQVVCAECNELLEKRSMKDCPSCRAPIQRRLCVRSADF